MEYKFLGNSDLEISRIAFGGMSLDLTTDNSRLIHQAVDHGINLFDTADLYDKGENELVLGKALKGARQKIHIATKVGNQWRTDGSGWDWNPSKSYIIEAVENSLKRLQTDYIDLYQLHGGTIGDPFDETLEAFELLQSQGKILDYGISSIRPNVIDRWLKKSKLSSIMMQYSLLDKRPEESCLKSAQDSNVGILSRGVLARGLLVDKGAKPYLNWGTSEIHKLQHTLIQRNQNRPPTHTALRYVLSHTAITSAVVGIRTPDQLKDVASVFDSEPLSNDEYTKLQQIIEPNTYQDHLV